MTNETSPALTFTWNTPVGWVGRQALTAASYLGGMACLLAAAFRSALRRDADPAERVSGQLSWMFAMGLPMVALVHVGLGSFLSMQSYFGGTFVEGTGAVVGVGLIRNVAPMMACTTLAGLLAARITPELRAKRRGREPLVGERAGFLERTAPGHTPAPRPVEFRADRAVAARLIAALVTGPVMGLWGSFVGTLVGWQVGHTLLGVSTHTFFLMFWDMLWARDVAGVVLKGAAFGLISGLFACHEGLRGAADDDLAAVSSAACRAACFSAVAILVINSGWFIVFYHAGPAFGPTLLAPPAS